MDDILRSDATFSLLFYSSLSLRQRKTLDKTPEETTMCNPDACTQLYEAELAVAMHVEA